MKDYLLWQIAIGHEWLLWKWRMVREATVLFRLLAGDWRCYMFHLPPGLCWCGREWVGNCCVSRSWKEDMDVLAGGFEDL
jgi:hypothetical protein